MIVIRTRSTTYTITRTHAHTTHTRNKHTHTRTHAHTHTYTHDVPSLWQYPETASILEALWTHIGNEGEGAANHPLLRDTARDVIQSLDETVRPFASDELDTDAFMGTTVTMLEEESQRGAEEAAAAELFRVLRAVSSAVRHSASTEAELATSVEEKAKEEAKEEEAVSSTPGAGTVPDHVTNSGGSDTQRSLADLLCDTVNNLVAARQRQR